jgi:hypothetical protein
MQTGCYARLSFSLPLSSSRSCRNGAQTGTAAAGYSRMTAAVPGPLILAEDGQSLARPRAELAFHRTRDATCRVPRAGRFSGWTMHTPAADSNAARRASRMARQTAQMTSSHPDERDRAGGVGSGTRPRPRGTMVMRARCGDGGRIVSRSGAGRSVGVARPAHSVTAGGSSSCRCRGLEQRCRHQTLARSRGAAYVQPSPMMRGPRAAPVGYMRSTVRRHTPRLASWQEEATCGRTNGGPASWRR